MLKDFSWQAAFMGTLAPFVGFASSFAVILQGLIAVGASDAQAASGVMVTALAMGAGSVVFALWAREPASCAWTTPGAAFLVTSGGVEGGFPVAVGAFAVCALAITLAGLIRPIGALVAKIPTSLAAGMLGGILLTLCFAPFKAIAYDWTLGLPILLAWIIVGTFNRLLAVPAALLAFIGVIVLGVDIPDGALSAIDVTPTLAFVTPEFTIAGLIGLAIPLFIITMASQNLPGIAVMKTYDYPLRPGLWFTTTGLFSLIAAFFSGVAINLAAITAVMLSSEEAHEDKTRRYWASLINGVFYMLYGLAAATVIAFVTLAPSVLIQAVAGLALISAFANATLNAFLNADDREAATVTFLMTASGISILGIGGAFWGLVAGGFVLVLKRITAKDKNAA